MEADAHPAVRCHPTIRCRRTQLQADPFRLPRATGRTPGLEVVPPATELPDCAGCSTVLLQSRRRSIQARDFADIDSAGTTAGAHTCRAIRGL